MGLVIVFFLILLTIFVMVVRRDYKHYQAARRRPKPIPALTRKWDSSRTSSEERDKDRWLEDFRRAEATVE